MSSSVIAIVEGHGEVAALPALLRRLIEWRKPSKAASALGPIKVQKDRFLNRDTEFNRFLQLAASKCGADGWILILLDADDACPKEMGVQILKRAQECVPHRRISVVLANREYEAWFIAAARSLSGKRGFTFSGDAFVEAERPLDAKGWVKARMSSGNYGETTDQPAFTALMNLDEVHERSRVFRKLCDEWERQAG